MRITGFLDESKLVRAAASRFKTKPVFAKLLKYRAGELAVFGPTHVAETMTVVTNITEDPITLFRAGCLAEALRDQGTRRVNLLAPWIAYGRQDRATRPGESPAGRVIGKFLARVFDRIVTLDTHSLLFCNAFRGRLLNVIPVPSNKMITLIAAPDRGATERARHVAQALDAPLLIVDKKRAHRGVIASRLQAREKDVRGAHILLIDDIADSGETLASAACVFKTAGAKTVSAHVTHAVNLAELRRTHRGVFRRIDSCFDHATGRLTREAIEALCDAAIV